MKKQAVAAFAAVAAVIALAPAPASAHRSSETAVRYSDLDLKQPEQVAELDRRLTRAVADVCGNQAEPDIQKFHDWHRCLNQARNAAREGRAIALGGASGPARHVIVENDAS